jgi:hypothetical protein
LRLAAARDVAVLGLEHRADLLAQLRAVGVSVRRHRRCRGGLRDLGLLADDRQCAAVVALKAPAVGDLSHLAYLPMVVVWPVDL